jgi:hypothetical protein
MNPAKRKKLYRLELAQQKQEVTPVEQKTETTISVIQETPKTAVSDLELGLKVLETTETVDSKKEKDKKKKTTTQEA